MMTGMMTTSGSGSRVLIRPAIPGTLHAASELEHLRAKLAAVELEQYLERRQFDRQLARLGVHVKATPRPRRRSAPGDNRRSSVSGSAPPSNLPEIYLDPATRRSQAAAAEQRALFRPAIGRLF